MAKNNKDEEQKKPNIVVNPNIGEEVQQPQPPQSEGDIVLTNGTNTGEKIAAQPNTAMQGAYEPTPQTTPSNEPINPTTPTAAPTEQATPTPAKSATQELIDSIKAGSEEERQRIERRRQAEETISGIADMGKALSNLYFTGKGAPNMYDAKTAMTPKARERYERALKNWNANRAANMQYALSKQSAELKEESNRIAQGRLEEQERHNKVVEGRQQEQLDFTKAQKEVENALKEEGLNVRERIARMNNATRQMSISQRSTLISPYKKVKQKVRDPQTGEVSEIEYRFTVDPITGEIKGEELRNVNNGNTKTKPAANGGKTSAKSKVSIHNKN